MNLELQAAVESLGLEKIRRHIFLCVDAEKPKCCPRETGQASWNFLKQRLKELNLGGLEFGIHLIINHEIHETHERGKLKEHLAERKIVVVGRVAPRAPPPRKEWD